LRWLISAFVLFLIATGGLITYSYILTPGDTVTTSPPPASAPPAQANSTKAKTKKTSLPAAKESTEIPQLDIASNARDKSHEATGNSLLIALIVMSIATLFSVAISFYLYRWRRLLLANSHMVVPEAFGTWINTLNNEIRKNSQSVTNGFGHFDQRCGSMEEKLSSLIDTFMTLHRALDEKDTEIKRLKRGYDAEIYRKFVGRFIRVDQAIVDLLASGQADQTGLEQVQKLLEDAFDECGLEKFSPSVGDDYRQTQGVADNPKVIPPEKPDDAFNIAEVLEAGYRRRNQEGYEVILPAKVKIFGMNT